MAKQTNALEIIREAMKRHGGDRQEWTIAKDRRAPLRPERNVIAERRQRIREMLDEPHESPARMLEMLHKAATFWSHVNGDEPSTTELKEATTTVQRWNEQEQLRRAGTEYLNETQGYAGRRRYRLLRNRIAYNLVVASGDTLQELAHELRQKGTIE